MCVSVCERERKREKDREKEGERERERERKREREEEGERERKSALAIGYTTTSNTDLKCDDSLIEAFPSNPNHLKRLSSGFAWSLCVTTKRK